MSEPDKQGIDLDPVTFWKEFRKGPLGLIGGLRFHPSQAITYSVYMSVHADRIYAESEIQDQVRRLSSHSGELEEFVPFRGYFSAVPVDDDLGALFQVLGLHGVESRRIDKLGYDTGVQPGQLPGARGLFEESPRGLEGHLVLGSEGYHGGDEDPVGVPSLIGDPRNRGNRAPCDVLTDGTECFVPECGHVLFPRDFFIYNSLRAAAA